MKWAVIDSHTHPRRKTEFENELSAPDYNARMSLTSGTKLGPYEIQSLLGAGGMGEVYLARDTRLQRTVAIKILPAHLSSNPDLRTRFEQEANPSPPCNIPTSA